MKTKIYDKRDDLDFDIVNFPFLDGDGPRSASYGVYISQVIRSARVSSHVDDFNTRNKVLTAKLLKQGYRYHKLRKAFSKFYRRHYDIVSKYNVGLKTLLLQGLSEPEFYGDFVYKFRKIISKYDFPYHFKKIIVRYKKIGCNRNVMRQTACLVVNPIKGNSFAYLFNCTTVGRNSDWMTVPSQTLLKSNTGGWWLTPFPDCLRLGLSWFNWWVSFAPEFQCCYFCESSCFFLF